MGACPLCDCSKNHAFIWCTAAKRTPQLSIATEAKIAELEDRVKSLEAKAECYVIAKSVAEDLGFESLADALHSLRGLLHKNGAGKRNG